MLLWLVLGPGGLRKAPGGPGKAHVGLWGASEFPQGPGQTNKKTHTFCEALSSGPGMGTILKGGGGVKPGTPGPVFKLIYYQTLAPESRILLPLAVWFPFNGG